MPCIVEKNTCANGGNLWVAFCGKIVWRHNNPYLSVKHAHYSKGAICKKCRRLSKIDEVNSNE